jgi:hypothetical protein
VRPAPLLRRTIAFVLDAVVASLWFVAFLGDARVLPSARRRTQHDLIGGVVVVDGRSP